MTIVSGGTSDGPVVTEARVRAELLGTRVVVHADAGVAGLHRLAPALDDLARADCVVVVAGQDAALASVVGGLAAAPVIGVPTSTGYGAAFGGVSALLAMLCSCAAAWRWSTSTTASARARSPPGSPEPRTAQRDPDGSTRLPAGIAGDMLLGALLTRARDPEAVRRGLAGLGVDGLRARPRSACCARVGGAPRPSGARRGSRTATGSRSGRRSTARASRPRARARAQEAFRRLADAEGRIHGIEPERVHFHEVGAVDAIGEVCGVALALEALAIDRVVCSPLPAGRGRVDAAHGRLPLPAPATLALLVGAPLYGVESDTELVTPTGAALVAALAEEYGPLPPMTLEAVGYGAGARDTAAHPTSCGSWSGRAAGRSAAHPVLLLEANLDDLLPELAPDAAAACFAAGALDVWTTPRR